MHSPLSKFALLIKNTIPWTILYFFVGALIIYFGIDLKKYSVLSNTMISVGGSILAIGLVTVWVEVSSSWHILQILHLYGDFKSHGIYRVFSNNKDKEFKELYDSTTANPKEIRILTLIGRKYIDDGEKIQKTFKMVKNAQKANILFIAIDDHGYNYRYNFLEPDDDVDVAGKRNKDLILKNQKILEEMIRKLNNINKFVKYYKTLPMLNLEFFDQYLFISIYGLKSRAKNRSPIFVFEQKSSPIYEYFETQFDNYLKDIK